MELNGISSAGSLEIFNVKVTDYLINAKRAHIDNVFKKSIMSAIIYINIFTKRIKHFISKMETNINGITTPMRRHLQPCFNTRGTAVVEMIYSVVYYNIFYLAVTS